jgi:aryl-alcohol dehydrogenase-like predicted oxidoreductase
MDRRGFLAGTGAALAVAALPPAEVFAAGPDAVPKKAFGKTGEKVSALAVGGHALGSAKTLDEAIRIAHEAIDAGVTFFDNCWEYHEHKSEEWMGKALEGKRDKVFLMTKVCSHGRDKKVALEQLDESLKRLRTEHLDLWMIHEVVYENDPDLHFARGGAVEALEAAKKAGKARYVGFTGHKHPRIHLKMLSHGFPFDAVLMPLNCFDATYRSFEQQVLPELIKQGIAPLGMKSLGGGGQPILKGVLTIEEALRYAMSLPVATTISGMDSLAVLHQNLKIARGFKPYSADEMAALRKRCAPEAADGHLELYKSTAKYDGAVGREQHGFPPMKEVPL